MKLVKWLVFLLVGRIIRFKSFFFFFFLRKYVSNPKFCILRLKYKGVVKMSLQGGIVYFIHGRTFEIVRDF